MVKGEPSMVKGEGFMVPRGRDLWFQGEAFMVMSTAYPQKIDPDSFRGNLEFSQ